MSKTAFTYQPIAQRVVLWFLFFMIMTPHLGNAYEVLSSKEAVERVADNGVKYEGKTSQDEEIAKKVANSIALSDGTPEKIFITHTELGYHAGIFVGEELCNQLTANPLTRKRMLNLWWMFFSINVPDKEIGQEDTMYVSCGVVRVATVTNGKSEWEL